MMGLVAHGTIIVVARGTTVGMVVIQLSANAGTRNIRCKKVVLFYMHSYLSHPRLWTLIMQPKL
jgi:hypothetical protein